MKIRELTIEDKPMVEDWLSHDEVHRKLGLKWEDVVAEDSESFLISTDDDKPLMVLRTQLALRAAIQFSPDRPYACAKYANEVINFMKNRCKEVGAKEIIIRPGGKAIHFAEKLGFKEFIGKFLQI